MRLWFSALLLVFISQNILNAQVISNVQSQLIPDSKTIQITYMLQPYLDEKYFISAYYIMDNEKEIKLESVDGDIGGGISGYGQKTIIWDVLNQQDVFQGRNIRFKISAERQTTIGESIGGAVVSTGKGIWYLFAGSDETQDFVNGLVLFGSYPMHNFSNSIYKKNKENGIIKLSQAWGACFRYQFLPVILTVDYILSKYDLEFDLKSSEAFIARHESVSGEINFTFLPILKQIIPSAGAGYQYGILHNGDYKSMVLSQSFYFNGMVEINLSFLTISASYRKSITSLNDRSWDQILLTAGLRFFSSSSNTSTSN